MGRLIDADKLKQHYAWWEIGDGEITYAEAKKRFDTIIDVQPTVEQPQTNATENVTERHGKWVHTKWSNMRHDYTCSLCGCRISGVDPFSLSATAYYYCPECGAKMDEVVDG